MNIPMIKDYTTHMPMLIKLVQMTDGPVLELGAGLFSTPLLHWLCHEQNRRLDSYEADPEYHHIARKFRSRFHRIHLVTDWDALRLDRHYSVALVDHNVERRSMDAIRLKDNVDYVILHDSEHPDHYHYDLVWPHYKYRFDWKGCIPWTTVVSNSKTLNSLAGMG